ncbi:MAG: hypothetical protein V1703_00500, partial [Candidatus Altiarchaeota archaeon]
MRNKGYVYTLIVMVLVLIITSLVSYYLIISEPVMEDVINKMRTDELYYFVESVKSDYDRSVSIAAQRSFVYLVDYSIKKDQTFDNYVMRNCTSLNYEINGSQAAAVELMLCGTLYGAQLPGSLMENHTLMNWSQRIVIKGDEVNFIVSVQPTEIKIIPYDSWNFYVLSKLDISVYDKLNRSLYRDYGIPIVSRVSINTMEDPLYSTKTGSQDLIRYFEKCNSSSVVNSTVIQEWIDSECYLQKSSAPSFFDRIDGNLSTNEKYVLQSQRIIDLGLAPGTIGMESFVDLDKFATYNISFDSNNSWVDYYYWRKVPAYCSILNMESHRDFKIDFDHAILYKIRDLNCTVVLENSFTPPLLWVPVNRTITWANANPAESCVLSV